MAHMTRVYQGSLKSFLCLARRTKAPQHHDMLFLNQYRYWSLKLMPSDQSKIWYFVKKCLPSKQQQQLLLPARLAQSVARETLNLKVVGSSPTSGFSFCSCLSIQLVVW
jgi:hypothetical protein